MTPEDVTPRQADRLTTEQRSEVLGLAASATRLDGVAPLSEQVLLAIGDDHPDRTGSRSAKAPHLLAYDGTHLAGYAHLERAATDKPATAELVVDPPYRRRSLGTALIQALEGVVAADLPPGRTLHVWSHGDLEGARRLAQRRGYSNVRELWQMRRSLRPQVAPLPEVSLPEGFRARHFVVGQDEETWLQVNARAFVDHPEQGRMTRSDLDRRVAEPWFDATGFIIIDDVRGPVPVLAASHWTKVVRGDSPGPQPPAPGTGGPQEGEVYVVGVDPKYQGLGLGRTVTVLGLEHLRARGLTEAMLYVDADNLAAVATYSRLDFARSAVDIMYSRTVHVAV